MKKLVLLLFLFGATVGCQPAEQSAPAGGGDSTSSDSSESAAAEGESESH